MSSMIKLNIRYLSLTVLFFAIETTIALFIHDNFIRPFVGDVLVVMLIYCFVKSFVNWPVKPVIIGVLIFSFFIEYLQYLNFVNTIGLQNSRLANTVLGNSFAWEDVLCYCAGALLVMFGETFLVSSPQQHKK
jgi:uncharacterized membrane protein YvlD (DUF360 family)